ncbi:MAG: PAS domain S-box protein [Pirellulales bacterium]|nr:PAS domain S-box protein [Pirellulales bacterium]
MSAKRRFRRWYALHSVRMPDSARQTALWVTVVIVTAGIAASVGFWPIVLVTGLMVVGLAGFYALVMIRRNALIKQRVDRRTDELHESNENLKKEIAERERIQRRFCRLLESAPDAMVIVDREGTVLLVNAQAERIFGYTSDELKGRSVEILVPQEFRFGHIAQRTGYCAAPRMRPMEERPDLVALRKDGSTFPAEISVSPIETDDGLLVAAAIRDVTQRKRIEQSLRESEERFFLAVRGTDAGIWDWNLTTNQVYFSPRWKSMLGYDEDELADTFAAWEGRLHPQDLERALQTLRDYLEGRTAKYELEHRLRHKDGSYRWILARGAALRDGSDRPYRMVGSHLDVTDRKTAEEALREQELQLRAAQRIQASLLPQHPPQLAGFDVAAASHPAELTGGDTFDYLALRDGAVGFVIADVSGHGLAPALLMASTQAHFRSVTQTQADIAEIVRLVNDSLVDETCDGHFVTVFLGRLDLRSRTFAYISAGHPAAYILDRFGRVKACLESQTLPLGLCHEVKFSQGGPVNLESGDLVLMLTDGVFEAQGADGAMFGTARALEVVAAHVSQSPEKLLETLFSAVRDFCRDAKLPDDVTAMVIKAQ